MFLAKKSLVRHHQKNAKNYINYILQRKLFIKIESFAMRDDLPLKCQESDNTEIFDHALAETLKDELAIVDVSTSIKRRCELNLMEKKFLRSKLEKMKKFYCTGEKPVMHIEAIIKKLQL